MSRDDGAAWSAAIGQALNGLRVAYGAGHSFGYNVMRREFWVIKDGRVSTLLTAPNPVALGGRLDARRAAS